ncbi:MAG: hypothetical protein ACR2L3_03635, partial [Actinomycetota bacterium]
MPVKSFPVHAQNLVDAQVIACAKPAVPITNTVANVRTAAPIRNFAIFLSPPFGGRSPRATSP